MDLTMGMLSDDFIEKITSELREQLLEITKNFLFKGSAEQLIETIQELQPIIREIQYSGVELSQTRQSQLSSLMRTLEEGVELSKQVKTSSRWNVYRNIFLARKMDKIEKRIEGFIQGLVQAHTLADVHHVRSKMAERLEVLEESTRRIEQLLGMTASGGSMMAAWPLNEMGLGKPILSPFMLGMSGPRSEGTADAGGKDFEPLKTSSLEDSTRRIEQLPEMRAGGGSMLVTCPPNETGLGKPMLSPFVLGRSGSRSENTADAGGIKDFEPVKNTCNSSVLI